MKKQHKTIGWACFAPSGAISWRSVETNQDASLAACFGQHWQEIWPALKDAGWTCTEVMIQATEDIAAASVTASPTRRRRVVIDEQRLHRAAVAVARSLGWEHVPEGDKLIQNSSNPRAKEFVASARAALEA